MAVTAANLVEVEAEATLEVVVAAHVPASAGVVEAGPAMSSSLLASTCWCYRGKEGFRAASNTIRLRHAELVSGTKSAALQAKEPMATLPVLATATQVQSE